MLIKQRCWKKKKKIDSDKLNEDQGEEISYRQWIT